MSRDTRQRTNGGACESVWSFTETTKAISNPVVVGDMVFAAAAAAADGRLCAFELSPAS
jgi:hypothetical protein